MLNLRFFLFALLAAFGVSSTMAYDFSMPNNDGVTIYYQKMLNNTVAVSYKDAKTQNTYSGKVVIPESVEYDGTTYTVAQIGQFAFSRCSDLTEVEIPPTVTLLSSYSFEYCTSLTSIALPESVTSIGENAFFGCTKLQTITLGNAISQIGPWVFNDTALYGNQSNWEEGMLYIGPYLIKAKSTTSGEVIVKDGTLTIASYAFDGYADITSVRLPESLLNIDPFAFNKCKGLTSVELPASLKLIGGWCFQSCYNLTTINIPETVTTIGRGAFSGSGLTSIYVPAASLEYYVFSSCKSLKHVTLGDKVTKVGDRVFESSTAIETVECQSTVPPTCGSDNTFSQATYQNAQLIVPDGCAEAYKSKPVWKKFGNISEQVGVEAVNEDRYAAPVEFYDLRGSRVANPEGGVYIRRQGASASKVVVK